MIKNYVMQGDVLIKKCGANDVFVDTQPSIPNTAKKVKGNLVLKGTTNSHALYGGQFQLYKDDKGVLFIRVTKTTKLDHVQDHKALRPKHAEHHAIKIPPGDYYVSPLMEYDHGKEESRQVID